MNRENGISHNPENRNFGIRARFMAMLLLIGAAGGGIAIGMARSNEGIVPPAVGLAEDPDVIPTSNKVIFERNSDGTFCVDAGDGGKDVKFTGRGGMSTSGTTIYIDECSPFALPMEDNDCEWVVFDRECDVDPDSASFITHSGLAGSVRDATNGDGE